MYYVCWERISPRWSGHNSDLQMIVKISKVQQIHLYNSQFLLIFMGHPIDDNEVTVWIKECGLLMRFQSHLGGTRITTEHNRFTMGESWKGLKEFMAKQQIYQRSIRQLLFASQERGNLSSMLLYLGNEDHKWRVWEVICARDRDNNDFLQGASESFSLW